MLLSTRINLRIQESIVDQHAIPFPTQLDRFDPGDPASLTGRADATLGDVIAIVTADISLSVTHRRDLLSALRRLAEMLGHDPRLIPATPEGLRVAFKTIVPVAHGIKRHRWSNIRSRVLAGVALAGIKVMPGRSTGTLTLAWATLMGVLPQQRARLGLSRFMHYCSRHGIAPEEVDETTFDRFRTALETESTASSPQKLHRTAVAQWNLAVGAVPGWPGTRTTLPRNGRTYSLAWSAFPQSFVTDVEAFLGRSSSTGPFADEYVRPQRPSTIVHQRKQIQQMASLLVLGGTPTDAVTGLAVLVDLANAQTILKGAHKRLGDGASHLHGMANLLKVIAANWTRSAPGLVKQLTTYTRRLAPTSRGMTEKNRTRLRQFDNTDNLHMLLDLPRRVFGELKSVKHPTRAAALRAQFAMVIELLTAAPMRFSNLASLDLTRHILTTGRGARQVLHIVIPANEVKNSEPYEVAIPARTAALLDVYRSRYLPLISTVPTPLLFPSNKGKRRDCTTFTSGLSKFIERETGLLMNAHLFRHLAVSLYLERHPEDLETARRILGHKSLVTTMRFYADIKTATSFSRYDEMLDGLRSHSSPRGKFHGTGRGSR